MERVSIEGIFFDPVTMSEAVSRILNMATEKRSHAAHVVTVNAQFMEVARQQVRFANVLRRADLSVADGMSLVWASRILQRELPERVTGINLMIRLCEEAARKDVSVYLLGGRPGSAECAAQRLTEANPGLKIAGIDCPPNGFMDDAAKRAAVVERIEQARPDLLFVAFGAPKQEYWIEQHSYLPAKVMIGVGGTFEMIAGYQKRAPMFMQKAGCEWLWRLAQEPKRLWRRYLVGNTLFVIFVLKQLISEWKAGSYAQAKNG